MSVAPAEAPERTENEYAHLVELFVERAGLAADDPRRAVLRAELITGYLPVARNIAHRFLHRGDSSRHRRGDRARQLRALAGAVRDRRPPQHRDRA